MEKDFGSVFVSEVLVEAGPLEGLFVILKIILNTLTAAVKFALQNASTRSAASWENSPQSRLLLACSHEC